MRCHGILLLAGVLFVTAVVGETTPADYVGRSVCAECHEPEEQQWTGSHHDLAMQPATAETVLGNFADARLTHFGVTTSFYTKLADLYWALGREAESEKVLRQAAKINPGSADVRHALGLSLVRQQRTKEGVDELRLAATLNTGSARYTYVSAVALNSTGEPEQAILVLQGAHNQYPNNRDILSALVAFHRDAGNRQAARSYAEKLRAVSPSP